MPIIDVDIEIWKAKTVILSIDTEQERMVSR